MNPAWWMIVPGNVALSAVILFVVAIPFLYAARRPLHGVILSLTRAVSGPLRMAARWLMLTAAEMQRRNTVVLLAHGREEIAQSLDREFERVTAVVRRDLHSYPALQRKLMDEITRIEEDYQKCGEVPPPPPEWTKAVETIAKIKPTSDGLVEKILEDIAKSVDRIYDKALSEYRRSYEGRHKILKGFMPFWRSLDQTLNRVDKNLTGMQESATKIDAQMDKYEQVVAKTDRAEQMLTASATVQFVIATVVLAVALGGAFVNFKLISLPMSAMVGGGDYITNNLQASDIAALVIIFVEATMGLFLMETLRFTHLFPRINNLNDRMRRRLMLVAFTILLVLAGVEVALAVMRDQIVSANLSLLRSLNPDAANVTAAAAARQAGWVTKVPAWAQMVLGFTLPFALAFLGIPLEYFIHSARTVLGVLLVVTVRGTGFALRFFGHAVKHLGTTLVMLYDALIFIPLLIERAVQGARGAKGGGAHGADVASFPKRSTLG